LEYDQLLPDKTCGAEGQLIPQTAAQKLTSEQRPKAMAYFDSCLKMPNTWQSSPIFIDFTALFSESQERT